MRIGLCTWSLATAGTGQPSLDEILDQAAQEGFATVEGTYALRGPLSPRGKGPGPGAGRVGSLMTLLLYHYPLTHPDARVRLRGAQHVAGMVECAAHFQAPSVSFSPGPLWEGQTLSACLNTAAETLLPILDTAARKGVRVALENVPGHCLETRSAMQAALERFAGAVSVCLDVGNSLVDPPTAAWVEEFLARAAKVHLSDGRCPMGLFTPAFVGQGDVPWPEVRAALANAGYQGDCFVECPAQKHAEPDTFIRNARAAIEELGFPCDA